MITRTTQTLSIALLLGALSISLTACANTEGLGEQRAADGGFGDGNVDACIAAAPAPTPTLLPGHLPLTTSLPNVALGPPPRVVGGATTGECKGGCGAGCNMNNRVPARGFNQVARCTQWTGCDGRLQHRVDLYRVVSGSTHPFCDWHDACYSRCQQVHGAGTVTTAACERACDTICVAAPGAACTAPIQAPFTDILYPINWPTNPPGSPPLPNPRNWPVDACARWPFGGDTGAPQTGRVTFSELVVSYGVQDGACSGGRQVIVNLDQRALSEQSSDEETYELTEEEIAAIAELVDEDMDLPAEPPASCRGLDEASCGTTACFYGPDGCQDAADLACAAAE